MAFIYHHVKTGEVITTSNKITGKNWEEIKKPGKKETSAAKVDDKKVDGKKAAGKKVAGKKPDSKKAADSEKEPEAE